MIKDKYYPQGYPHGHLQAHFQGHNYDLEVDFKVCCLFSWLVANNSISMTINFQCYTPCNKESVEFLLIKLFTLYKCISHILSSQVVCCLYGYFLNHILKYNSVTVDF